MKYDHSQAQGIYSTLGGDKKIYPKVLKRMKDSLSVGPDIAEIFEEVVRKSGKSTELKEKIVATAEAIYKAFSDSQVKEVIDSEKYLAGKSSDELFEVVLLNLSHGLSSSEVRQDVMGFVEDIYHDH